MLLLGKKRDAMMVGVVWILLPFGLFFAIAGIAMVRNPRRAARLIHSLNRRGLGRTGAHAREGVFRAVGVGWTLIGGLVTILTLLAGLGVIHTR